LAQISEIENWAACFSEKKWLFLAKTALFRAKMGKISGFSLLIDQ
jgi:hypothetical protein